jgi:hypothetical protein
VLDVPAVVLQIDVLASRPVCLSADAPKLVYPSTIPTLLTPEIVLLALIQLLRSLPLSAYLSFLSQLQRHTAVFRHVTESPNSKLTYPSNLLLHLLTLYIEDLSGTRTAKISERRNRDKSDFESTTSYSVPKIEYLVTLVRADVDRTGKTRNVDDKAKLIVAKTRLLSGMLALGDGEEEKRWKTFLREMEWEDGTRVVPGLEAGVAADGKVASGGDGGDVAEGMVKKLERSLEAVLAMARSTYPAP